MSIERPRPSDLFFDLAKGCEAGELSLASLVGQMGVKSHALIVLLFSMPFLTPIPMPGLSIILGAVIALSGVAIIFGKPIWLPEFIGQKKIKNGLISKIISTAALILKKVEFIFKPRLSLIANSPGLNVVTGLVIAVSGFILLLPLPPGTNFPPAFVCAVLSIGLVEKDGFAIIFGILIFAAKIFLILGLYSHLSIWASQL